MRSALLLLSVAVAGAACMTSKGGESQGSSQPSARPSASVAAFPQEMPSATAIKKPVPEGPPKWKSIPKEQNGFYVVLDGLCSKLAAARVGKDVVVHYGGESMYATERTGHASFIALRDDGLETIGDPAISSPTGIAGQSLEDFWIADSTGSRSSEGAVLHRYTKGQWKTYAKDQTNLHAWVDGGIIGALGFAAHNGEVWVEGSTTKPPEALHADLWYPALSAFPTGEVLVIAHKKDESGARGDKPLVARSWAPGKKVTEHPLAKFTRDPDAYARMYEIAPDEVYAVIDTNVLRWDGTAFRALGATKGGAKISLLRRVAADDVWVVTEDGALQHITKDGVSPIATPEPVASLDGVDRGAAWMAGASGKLYKREGDAWKEVPLAPPAFSTQKTAKAKQIVVAGPDEVLVVAAYWEKGLGWKEQELHWMLLRTKSVKETLRCNEPDPENNNVHMGRGFQSWPPMVSATSECATPFVVLARRSNAVKREDDWPRLKKALEKKPDLGDVALVEFTSGDRTFVGTKAKDLDAAKKIVDLAVKADRLRPEIVCGDPDAKRTIALTKE